MRAKTNSASKTYAVTRLASSACLQCLLACGLLILIVSGYACAADDDSTDLEIYADFRFRAENDWNSLRPDGMMRDNRDRYRIRFRAGAEYALTDAWNKVRDKMRSVLNVEGRALTPGEHDQAVEAALLSLAGEKP